MLTLTDDARGVLNGLFGDLLAERGSPLALPMTVRCAGTDLSLAGGLRPAVPAAPTTRSVCVFAPGLMSSDRVWEFPGRPGTTYGSRLAADRNVTPAFVAYNSGRHVSVNGRELAVLLERLVAGWPGGLDEISLVGHSMGGLVIRSACHHAALDGRSWPGLVRRVILLGAPLAGAALEKVVHTAEFTLTTIWNPATRLVGRCLRRRSAGIKDLRFGSLVDDDWAGRDPDRPSWPCRNPVPLLPGARHYAVGGMVAGDGGRFFARFLGDPLVTGWSVEGRSLSTWGRPLLPDTDVRHLARVGHLALAHHDAVYGQILNWWDEEA